MKAMEDELARLGWVEDGITFNRRIFSHPKFDVQIAEHNCEFFICKWPSINYNRRIDTTFLIRLHALNDAGVNLWEKFGNANK